MFASSWIHLPRRQVSWSAKVLEYQLLVWQLRRDWE